MSLDYVRSLAVVAHRLFITIALYPLCAWSWRQSPLAWRPASSFWGENDSSQPHKFKAKVNLACACCRYDSYAFAFAFSLTVCFVLLPYHTTVALPTVLYSTEIDTVAVSFSSYTKQQHPVLTIAVLEVIYLSLLGCE